MTTTSQSTFKTKLHHYRFDVSKPEQAQQYREMIARIESDGADGRGRWMNAWGGTKATTSKAGTAEDVEIDSAHVFENQWNETTESGNRRLFDWFEEYVGNHSIKQGHWLEITPEMVAARKNTRKCGYCGHQYGPLHGRDIPENGFCVECLDSIYLKESDLHLLRLLPLTGPQDREKLTEQEQAELIPQYVTRQTTGADSRAAQKVAKQRKDAIEECDRDTRRAIMERDGKLWILDHGLTLDNVIFYNHTERFCFGWQNPVGGAVLSKIRDIISEFPFQYTIETGDGRKLEN